MLLVPATAAPPAAVMDAPYVVTLVSTLHFIHMLTTLPGQISHWLHEPSAQTQDLRLREWHHRLLVLAGRPANTLSRQSRQDKHCVVAINADNVQVISIV